MMINVVCIVNVKRKFNEKMNFSKTQTNSRYRRWFVCL
jgi:hypothetical protein